MVTQSNTARTVALDFYEAIAKTLEVLYWRWQDEKEYENIEDYRLPLEAAAKARGVTITKMTKRPFGLLFTTPQGSYKADVTRKGVSYKRIA